MPAEEPPNEQPVDPHGAEKRKFPQPPQRDDHFAVFSPREFQQLREAIVSPKSFERAEDSPWPVSRLGRGGARGQAVLRPPAADEQQGLLSPVAVEAWAAEMWRQRNELTDLDADALDALSAIWLWQAQDPRDGAFAGVDDLLELRGIKPKRSGQGRRGGYEQEQRQDMLRALHHIQNIWLDMAEVEVFEDTPRRGRRKSVKKQVQSRAFVVTDRMGQMRLDGHIEVERFRFVPGEIFARFLLGAGRQWALLSAKALAYNPYTQTWEKRLARYLSWQWRIRAKDETYFQPYRVETLLGRAGEELNQSRPRRTQERLEKALDQLQTDGVIAGWQYDRFDDWFAQITRKGWANDWLHATVMIEPPGIVVDEYEKIKHPNTAKSALGHPLRQLIPHDDDDSGEEPEHKVLGARIRERRKERGLSQLKTAEELSISQSRLSRLESGKSRPTEPLKKRLVEWISE